MDQAPPLPGRRVVNFASKQPYHSQSPPRTVQTLQTQIHQMKSETVRPGTIWRKNQSNVSVLVTSLGFLRVGLDRSTKTPAVIYQSQHDGELTARSEAEFMRLFSPS